MRKFQFKLDALERHRKLQEQEKQVWLSKCIAKMRSTEKKLFDLDKREVTARREFSALGSPSQKDQVTSAHFWMLDQFIQGQKVRRVDLKQTLQENEQDVSGAYREYLHARQQKKIMEKLREKKFKTYKEELLAHELRENDELYVTRARLRSGEGDDHEE